MGARIIAIGQRTAGDDAVGLVVLDQLRQAELPRGTELIGEVLELDADALEGASGRPVSTHGVSVAQALGLARLLAPDAVAPSVSVVGVRIPPPHRYTEGLSSEVAAAVAREASLVVARSGAL